ncbi:aconitate hydratase [Desulfosporosinus sp. BICA1-9]|uniref:aconitate hydratase n=1 Tax=Desulfosporosinus sp. BICA1-9 TaxID=1531958 RepID=UPI00054B1CB1|nr:aconitate hydratase [Desulfosporosinus sp. BICA1-9]KJS46842.1 MAG: aconitate hydratase [Peptococcaceae bacterium BRH_c23]KJS80102.1 MAG: aconitate hydratase [Desulfosporosinus sp. BICA1-9]HBW34871.1 aconitate hydratase [Desulfosporosinus sp.]
MGLSLAAKIIKDHLVDGVMTAGEEIGLKIDQTLVQDATGTMAFLQFEAIGIPRVKTECSVVYVDHNTLQTGFESPDDHRFLQDMASNIGVYFSKPGNGICHQLQLERFSVPGKILLGADSHTPTSGGLGSLAIGAGGLDIAVAMGGGPFNLTMPRIINVQLIGAPAPWVTAKDIVLEVLKRLSVKGGIKSILEYSGEGLQYLSVPERATITNMGAETGATSSIFPSDEITKAFFQAQARAEVWRPLAADLDAEYDEVMEIKLNELQPMVACPHSPDNIMPVEEIAGMKVDQVMIGSCTNSSYIDLTKVAQILKGKKVHPDVNLVLACGSRQVFKMLAQEGSLTDIIEAGARVLECACGPCIGMGQSPQSKGISLRTVNRNFKGRSGTKDAEVYLVSPETAAASAIAGKLVDPRSLGETFFVKQPKEFAVDDSMIIVPKSEDEQGEVRRGPNIQALPTQAELPNSLEGEVLIKVGDNITTDHIMPAGAKILPLRSNIPAMAEHVFEPIDPEFPKRAQEKDGGLILGGDNYGQGSSREHAALAPMYLKVKAVLAKSIARIHHDNLVNFGIVPFVFKNPQDYDEISQGERLKINNLKQAVESDAETLNVENMDNGKDYPVSLKLSERQRSILLAGGTLNWTKQQS